MAASSSPARWIRLSRWLHRKTALVLFVFFLLLAATGLLLGVKKNTGLLAPTQSGVSKELSTWLPVDSLSGLAARYLHDSVDANLSTKLDRIDIRPGKGIVKFVYQDHYWGLQLDGTTGKLLLVEKRMSDFIEDLHDGSLFDSLLGTGDEPIKVGYTVIMGLSLLLLVGTGFWLWFGPRRMRQRKRHQSAA